MLTAHRLGSYQRRSPVRAIVETRPGKAVRMVTRKWSPALLKALVPEADGEPLDATQNELWRRQVARIGSLRADPKL